MIEKPKTNELHFDVSSGLKSVLGSELITDDEVAIFELVKNSFDAAAHHVVIYFSNTSIVIADNGIGMSYDDILNKWLFVAYSSKRKTNQKNDFRDEIAERRNYAGSKGIGRFSSDRLGRTIRLQTKPEGESTGPVHSIFVDWDLFDVNHLTHFDNIDLKYEILPNGFNLPAEIPPPPHGTVITIGDTRREWDRDSILRLKSALAKLINPFGAEADGFGITIIAPHEAQKDLAAQAQAQKKGDDLPPNMLANGEVGNFIFSTLQEKTTFLDVTILNEPNQIESTLIDRGELIYRIREPNPYPLLLQSGFKCQVYFLNQSAKTTFARRMGVPSVQFGSVFLFRNGFRVYPIGEAGDDWFGMDRRKQQGYARYLGTRDVIGRIDVFGEDSNFQEASSRNTGLIETLATRQLRDCFQDYCLKRLERYVVPVTFVDKEDKNTSDVSRLLTDPGRARVTLAVAKLVDNSDVELLDYSKTIIGLLNERSAHFENSLVSLRAIAEKTSDKSLYKSIEVAEKRFDELRRSEENARRQADEERAAKEAAQARANTAETLVAKVSEQLTEERKRNLFLSSISTLDTDAILNLHHQVTIYAVDIQQQIENFIVSIADQPTISPRDVIDALERVALLNRKIMGISKFATKANFRLEAEKIHADIGEYIEQYVTGVARDFLHGRPISLEVKTDGKRFSRSFKPIDISVVVDNLIANSRKQHARHVTFNITHPEKDIIHIHVEDDGAGFKNNIEDLNQVFEKGFTTTDGSGLGLYHVRQVLGEMNGTIEAARVEGRRGAQFYIRIAK